MATNNYNINMYQGQSFFLDIDYLDNNGFPVNMRDTSGPVPPIIPRYTAHMQVRRSPFTDKLILDISSDRWPSGVTGGGTGAQFGGNTDNIGVVGIGGISLNYDGVSGAIRLEIDHTTMGYVPAGDHFYDLNVLDTQTNYMDKVITGTVEVQPEVTR